MAAAARVFEILGSHDHLQVYVRLASVARGLPISDLRKRGDLSAERLTAALAALDAAGLVRAEGDGEAAWYVVNAPLLQEALAFAAGQPLAGPRGPLADA